MVKTPASHQRPMWPWVLVCQAGLCDTFWPVGSLQSHASFPGSVPSELVCFSLDASSSALVTPEATCWDGWSEDCWSVLSNQHSGRRNQHHWRCLLISWCWYSQQGQFHAAHELSLSAEMGGDGDCWDLWAGASWLPGALGLSHRSEQAGRLG